jgi:BMFP domain-containing protein YqiC
MFDPKILNELSKQFIESLPPAFKTMHQELDKTFRTVMGSVFSKMDLVSRQEFDAQAALLAENTLKLEALQKELEALSEKIVLLEKGK